MQVTKKWYFFFILFSFNTIPDVFCQNNANEFIVQPGRPMPDYKFNDVTNFSSRQVSISDFRGKWLFLDLWTIGCTACVLSFPKINELQAHFKDQLTYLLVGLNGAPTGNAIKNFYEKVKKQRHLNIATAYDSIIFEKLDVSTVPHIVIIDPKGIVVSITGGRDITKEKVQDLLSGKNVSFFPKGGEKPFDPARLSSKPLYHSILTPWAGETQIVRNMADDIIAEGKGGEGKGFQALCVPLIWLYNYAYTSYPIWYFPNDPLYKTHYPYPVLELTDSSLFEVNSTVNMGKGLYNYSLTLPDSKLTVENVMRIMQQDLKNTFGYNAKIEDRYVDVWNLIADSSAMKKLKSNDIQHEQINNTNEVASLAAGFQMNNGTTEQLSKAVVNYLYPKLPSFDVTGVTGKINISMDTDMTDLNAIKKQLKKYGLDLVLVKRMMKVIVIKDKD